MDRFQVYNLRTLNQYLLRSGFDKIFDSYGLAHACAEFYMEQV